MDPQTRPLSVNVGTLVSKGFAPFLKKIYILGEKVLYKRRKINIIDTVNINFFDTAKGGDSRRDSERRGDASQARNAGELHTRFGASDEKARFGTGAASEAKFTVIAERDGGKLP